MEKISAVYKIVNTVTKDFYIGSRKNVMSRWAYHRCLSVWKTHPNRPMYQDMQKYGVDMFRFQILAPVMPEYLKQVEQEFIDMLHPTYNNNRAKGYDVERYKEYNKEYSHSEKGKETQKRYRQSEEYKSCIRKYSQSDKGKKTHKKAANRYFNQLCEYNGETLKLITLVMRFRRAGIKHPTLEAKKYLLVQ